MEGQTGICGGYTTTTQYVGQDWPNRSLKLATDNIKRAIAQHRVENDLKNVSHLITFQPLADLKITFQASVLQGPKTYTEDGTFYEQLSNGNWIFGAYDGHGGDLGKAGPIVLDYIKREFLGYVDRANGDIRAAFRNLYPAIQERLDIEWKGTTLTLCYLVQETGLLVTATLGDSEAFFCTRDGEKIQVIPLSYVKTFRAASEMKRVVKYYEDKNDFSTAERVKEEYPNASKPRFPYSPPGQVSRKSINLSRSFGNRQFGNVLGRKPIVSVHQVEVKPEKTFACCVIVVTDGAICVDRFIERLTNKILIPRWHEGANLAAAITTQAVNRWKSHDNTSAIVAHIECGNIRSPEKSDEEEEEFDKENVPAEPNTPKFFFNKSFEDVETVPNTPNKPEITKYVEYNDENDQPACLVVKKRRTEVEEKKKKTEDSNGLN